MKVSFGARLGRAVSAGAAIAALGLLMVGCSGPSANPPSPIGFWGSEATDEPNLSFEADAVLGTDGCNRLSGAWSVDGSGRIQFENVVSTKMYCEWVDDWLAQLDSAEIRGDGMHVFDGDGNEIGTLAKN